MKRGFFDLTLLYCGCYWLPTWFVMTIAIWTIGLIANASVTLINLLMIGMSLFVLVSWYYLVKLGSTYRKDFFKTLESKGKKEAKLECPELKVFQVPKVTRKCPYQRKAEQPMEYTISFFYLCKESITIYTKCATFNLFKVAKAKESRLFIPKYKKKEACADILEYYYYYIQRIELSNNKIIFYFADGQSASFDCAKKHAKPIIKEIRNHLRKTAQRKMLHGYQEPFDVRLHKEQKAQPKPS